MSWMIHTGCRYHTQDTGYYCGAAAAMMILAEIGVNYSNLDQDDLYNSNHNNNAQSGWYTDPYGLRFTLIDRKPSSFSNTFVVHKPTSEADGSRDIVYTLHKYKVSPAVLVFGCAHWIVVPGVQTDVEPVTGSTYVIDGFWINNPVHEDNEPHSATDVCGSGGVQGSANEFITYADWQTTYFTGCDYDDASGNKQYISVCDPDVRKIELPSSREKIFLADGKTIIRPKEALRFAHTGLEEYGLVKNELVARSLDGTEPGEPLLVLRLDKINSYYYLVPWEKNGVVTAMTRLDARFGFFSGIRLVGDQTKAKMITRNKVMKYVSEMRLDLPEKLGRFRLFPETACLSPTLVWQPCWESWSPNLPFYQLTIGNIVIYIRMDGKIFTKLTMTGRGA